MISGRIVGIRLIAILAVLLALPILAGAVSFKIPKKLDVPIKVPEIGVPGLESLTGDDEVISTSFADATTSIPFLDSYSPEQPFPLEALKPDKEGAFDIWPGTFAFDARSYCLHAGTYGPSKGDGYLYAPLKGGKAGIIRTIATNSLNHPEVPQEDVQMLIWGIQSKTQFSKMPRNVQRAATKLLSPGEIRQIDGGTLGIIPQEKLNGLLSKFTEPVRRALRAQNSIREKLSVQNPVYDDLERVAVLTGEPPADERGPVIPSGRWSYHPGGYFISFKPHTYRSTYYEICWPDDYTIERDAKGRILSIVDSQENRIQLAYDDDVTPISISGDDQIKAYAFSSVKFTAGVQRKGEPVSREWGSTGWTFVGVPTGGGRPDKPGGRFGGLQARYENAVDLKSEFSDTTAKARKSAGSKVGPTTAADMNDLVDLAHLRIALDEAVGADTAQDAVLAVQAEGVVGAWQHVFKRSVVGVGVQVTALPGAILGQVLLTAGRGGGSASASGGVASPSNTGKQRLLQSSQSSSSEGSSSSESSDDDRSLWKSFKDWMREHGFDITSESPGTNAGNGNDTRTDTPIKKKRQIPVFKEPNGFLQAASSDGGSDASSEGTNLLLSGIIKRVDGDTVVRFRLTNLDTKRIENLGIGRARGTGKEAGLAAMEKALTDAGL